MLEHGRIYVAPPDFHLLVDETPGAARPRARPSTATGLRSTRSSARPRMCSASVWSASSSRARSTTGRSASLRSRPRGGVDGRAGPGGRDVPEHAAQRDRPRRRGPRRRGRRPGRAGQSLVGVDDAATLHAEAAPRRCRSTRPATSRVSPRVVSDAAQRARGARRTACSRRCSSSSESNRGFDFTGYKRPSLGGGSTSAWRPSASTRYADYLALPRSEPGRVRRPLRHDPDQRHGFFRDPSRVGVPGRGDRARGSLEQRPRRRRSASGRPGCASGEEAYTRGDAPRGGARRAEASARA